MAKLFVACGFALVFAARADEALSLLQVRSEVLKDGPHSVPAASKPLRVAVIGAGTSGHAAVYSLKKRHGSRFNVTLFEQKSKIGGVVTSTQYGASSDWNQGFADSGMIVSARFSYPNMFSFFDAEGLQTTKRSMDQFVYDSPVFDNSESYQKELREFYEHLVRFHGNFEEFIEKYQGTTNSAEKWFIETNKQLTKGRMAFMTLDVGSMTDHVAGAILMLNITGNSHYEAPAGGYIKYSEKAASYADLVLTDAKVTQVQPKLPKDVAALNAGTPSITGPVSVAWSGSESDREEEFDAVILCVGAHDIKRLFPKMDLPTEGWNQTIVVHKKHHGDSTAFFNQHAMGDHFHLDVYPNGNSPPYVSFFSASCDEQCISESIPAGDIYAAYPHETWIQDSKKSRQRIAAFLRGAHTGQGGIHFAGVWTTDGRFAEGAWVSGMRAAFEVAGEDPQTYEFPSECTRRSFLRYALWFKESQVGMNLAAIPPSCFADAGEVPSYFKSAEEYEAFYKSVTAERAREFVGTLFQRERAPFPARASIY